MLLLLALAGLVAVQAAESQPSVPQSGSFVDWINKQSSSQAQLAYAADETEGTSLCMQDMRLQNCRCLSENCKRTYAETQLTRCSTGGEKSYSNLDDLRAKQLSVGGCTFTEEFFDTPLSYENSETTKLGQFTGTCEMREEAGKCDGVLCEGNTLLISGDILGFPRVAFQDGLSEPISTCEPDQRAQGPMRINMSREKRGIKAAGAYSVGAGAIYVGNIQVVSNQRNVQHRVGRFQQVVATGTNFERAASPPEKSFVAKDLVTKLEFF